MIQVIGRVFKVMECLGPETGVSLEELTSATALNKGTLCNILKSLVELGYIEKAGAGSYRLGVKVFKLAEPFSKEKILSSAGERFTKILAEKTKESGVLATVRENKVHIIAQAQFQRALMLNPYAVYDNLSMYHSVSGRILISYLAKEKRAKIVAVAGMPGLAWDNAKSMASMEKKCSAIRNEGIAIMSNQEKEIKSFAVSVFDSAGDICASLGLTVPLHRINDEYEKNIIDSLKKNSENLRKSLIKENLSQRDFMKDI